ncbi:MAG: hypothetical protein KAS71_14705 [Bacteroidales bacterium]|nr:hypothetical protein [Bacteroidales bacterium]
MRKLILIVILNLCSVIIYSQEDSTFSFDEFSVSINRSTVGDLNTEDRFGFGAGAYHNFRPGKRINLVFGLEFNRTSQFKKYMYAGHFASSTNITYIFNSFSMPLSLMINFGNKTKVFLETGTYIDTNWGNRKGTMHTFYTNEFHKEYDFDEKISNNGPNLGVSIGMGLNIPVSKFTLIIKPEIKYGLFALSIYGDKVYNRYFRFMIGLKK